MLAVYFFLLTFWGEVIKFTNWIYLFLFTANFYVSQNTQMMQLTSGHFVLHKKSNMSLHLIVPIVQSMELTPTEV